MKFISFDDIRKDPHILDDIDVLLNVGDADTAYTGGENWTDEKIVTAVKGFIYNGGGFIGVGEPAGHQYQGHFLQLATVMGVEKETGFTLNVDKYNWEEHDHFIKEDCTKEIDFGEGKKNMYALDGAEILVQRDKKSRWRSMNSEKDAAYISADCRTALKTAVSCTVLLSGRPMMKKMCTDGSARTLM